MYIRVIAYTCIGMLRVAAAQVDESKGTASAVLSIGGSWVPLGDVDAASAGDCLALLGEALIDLAYSDVYQAELPRADLAILSKPATLRVDPGVNGSASDGVH